MAASEDYDLTPSTAVTGNTAIIIGAFLSISLYNFLELNFIIVTTFKRHHGLYFWSFVVATWGMFVATIGFLLRDFDMASSYYIYASITLPGWWFMVTGQALVLYSRLHLVVYKRSWLRAVLAMIIVNALVCYIPVTILSYGVSSLDPDPFIAPYLVFERIQVTLIFIQEVVISTIYIYETLKLIQATSITGQRENRMLLKHLIFVNGTIILLDVPILVLQYLDRYRLQTSYKSFAYSSKLKLEFSILNRLVYVQSQKRNSAEQDGVTVSMDAQVSEDRDISMGNLGATQSETRNGQDA